MDKAATAADRDRYLRALDFIPKCKEKDDALAAIALGASAFFYWLFIAKRKALGVAVIALASVAFVQVNPGGDVSHLNEHQVSASR